MNGAATLVVDAAIAITLVELVVLVVLWRRRGDAGRWAPRDFVANVGAGLFLMLGLRAALAGANWTWIAAALAAAGVCHVVDMTRRAGRR